MTHFRARHQFRYKGKNSILITCISSTRERIPMSNVNEAKFRKVECVCNVCVCVQRVHVGVCVCASSCVCIRARASVCMFVYRAYVQTQSSSQGHVTCIVSERLLLSLIRRVVHVPTSRVRVLLSLHEASSADPGTPPSLPTHLDAFTRGACLPARPPQHDFPSPPPLSELLLLARAKRSESRREHCIHSPSAS